MADPVMSSTRIRVTLVGVLLAMLLAMLDNAIAGTALPRSWGTWAG